MKKLLFIALAITMLACSSDDEPTIKQPTNKELEQKLVGQWSNAYKYDIIGGTLYRFYEDNTFQKYDIVRYDLTPKTIRKATGTGVSGKYWIEDYGTSKYKYLSRNGSSNPITFEGDTAVAFNGRFERDYHKEYVEIE